ncbi:hypothetical protein [Amycolatopsis saalfeldensis]|uniref:Uncharacterized protein n=1 Tax=Amycolatopsis saalfeldensis TaxID=394193 RepID=A0A1H8WQH2_9PSEU|nr:hypothetical protein [Amycolatopsis saalfeldensis]SEP29687.1 hypothetical protein SAMN04489732_105399 [Amycolatopsis saalfeldensis]
MSILRKAGAAGLLVAVSTAVAIAAAGTASAGASPPRIYGSYGECMAAGNALAQQGEAHGFHCVDVGAAPVGVPSTQWKLIIDF